MPAALRNWCGSMRDSHCRASKAPSNSSKCRAEAQSQLRGSKHRRRQRHWRQAVGRPNRPTGAGRGRRAVCKGFAETTTREIAARLQHSSGLALLPHFRKRGPARSHQQACAASWTCVYARRCAAQGGRRPFGAFIHGHLDGLFENPDRALASISGCPVSVRPPYQGGWPTCGLPHCSINSFRP